MVEPERIFKATRYYYNYRDKRETRMSIELNEPSSNSQPSQRKRAERVDPDVHAFKWSFV